MKDTLEAQRPRSGHRLEDGANPADSAYPFADTRVIGSMLRGTAGRWRALADMKFIGTVLLLAATVAYLFPITQVLYNLGDDGTILYGALRVSEGAVPGRDFVEVIGPGAFYWLGLFFKLFGTGWQVSRVYLLLTGVATAGVSYAIALRVCSKRGALLVWLFCLVTGIPIWPLVSHHWDSNLFAFIALWCYLNFEVRERPLWAAAAGILAAVTTCFMQQKGVLLLVAFAASALLRRIWKGGNTECSVRKALGLMTGSYAAVGLIVAGAFLRLGALKDIAYANVLWPLSGYGDINVVPWGFAWRTFAWSPAFTEFPPTRPVLGLLSAELSLLPFLVIVLLPLISGGLTLWGLVNRKRHSLWSPAFAVFLAGAALWLGEMHRKDIVHMVFGAPLLFVALMAHIRQFENMPRVRALAGALIACLIVFGVLNFRHRVRGLQRLDTHQGVVMSAANFDALRFLRGKVKENEFVFVYPYSPIYYYLAGIRNPTRYSILLYGYNTPEQFDEVIRNIEMKGVRYVLDSGAIDRNLRGALPGYRPPPANQLRLERYLGEHYEPVAKAGSFRILKRKADVSATDPGAPGTLPAAHAEN